MCHLVLMMPVLGLAVFWLWPLSVAAPLYAAIVVLSAHVYRAMITGMRRPAVTGREGLLHEIGEIVDVSAGGVSVQVHGELWQARSQEPLRPRDQVEVTGIQGLTLRVRKAGVPAVRR